MKTAVVLHMGETGLGITRSLGRLGIEVYGIDYEKGAEAFSSKYCKRRFVFANPSIFPETCLSQFIELGKSLNEKSVLLPASDCYVTFISKFDTVLADYFLYNIPSSSILKVVVDKREQYKFAEHHRIPVPKTFSPQCVNDLRHAEKLLQYPVFVKGANAHQWQSYFHKKGFVASNFHDLRKYVELALSKNIRVVIQEIVVGPNKNHFKVCAYYSKRKQLLSLFSTQKVRQFPCDFGVGTFMKSKYVPELIELGKRFFEALNYTGMGSIEFKKDDRDNTFKLIELNPRFWLQNIQTTCAELNFAHINYLDCLGETIKPSSHFKEDVCYLDPIPDFLSLLGNMRRGDISFLGWFKTLLRINCVAYFSQDDPKPAWKFLVHIMNLLSKRLPVVIAGVFTSPSVR